MTHRTPLRDDPGLQPERTTLAWQRTAIAYVGAALLFMRWATQHGPVVAVTFAGAPAVAAWTCAHPRPRLRRTARESPHRAPEPATVDVIAFTAGTALLGVSALWVTLAT